MSFPSLETENLSGKTRKEAAKTFLDAFWADLPKGMEAIEKLAESAHNTDQQVEMTKDPNSDVGQQIIRLLGTDVARSVLEQHFGLEFGLYNCCTAVAGLNVEMSFERQAELQSPEMVDC
jgi:hypothetical protein